MQLVVDTSVLIAVLLEAPEKEALVQATDGSTLIAPASVHWDIGNALSAMLKRKRLTLEHVEEALSAYEEIPIRFVDVPLVEALQFSAELDVYAYDGYVLACAAARRVPLLTLDRGMARAAAGRHIEVVEIRS